MNKPKERELTIANLYHICVVHWRWFAASVLICLLFAVKHIITAPYLYSRSASVMLREDVVGENVTDKNSKDFSELGFVKQKNNLSDILRHISSLDVLMEVAYRKGDSLTLSEALIEAQGIQDRLSVESVSDKSNIIDLVYKDSSTGEAEHVLSLIIQVYNEKWIHDKQEAIRSTSFFIDSKLKIIENELNVVDDSISAYKSRFGITNLENVSNVYLQQQSQTDAEILKLSNQKAMAEYIRSLLEDKSSQQLLLVNSGINNNLIESQITLYNSLLLQMQSHMEYTSGQNPLIINLEKELKSLQKNILSNVINHIRTIDIQIQSLEDYHSLTKSKISSNPTQAKHLISIEREQKVKESLYMFLLQKKEENEISMTYQSAPMQVIDLPHGSGKPTSPKRGRVLLTAVFLGFLIPLSVIFFRTILDGCVRDRLDIEVRGDIPFLGEVPSVEKEITLKNLLCVLREIRKKTLKHPRINSLKDLRIRPETAPIVVAYGRQDWVNEAFRIIRTRLELINNSRIGRNVYMFTSSQKESGKTFVAMNLAIVLALAGKRVFFIDGDLRKGTASRRWNISGNGLSEYLNGMENDIASLLFRQEKYPTLQVLPAGTSPANPTELLSSDLFDELIILVRQKYDYVIIDTPQTGIYADAEIIEKHTDCKLSVIRAGQFERRNLDDLAQQEAQSENRFIILNGVSLTIA